ncbi:MAG: ABC transporter permease [Thermoplasmata archaeon]|nr:ABC transporter permease [Thermoplasmata archaeon]
MTALPVPEPTGAPAGGVPRRESPSSLVQAIRLTRYQLRDYLLSRRFILMMAIVVIIGVILSAVVGHYRPHSLLDNSNDLYSVLWAMFVYVVIVFAGIIFGGDAIAGEFQNKTGYFLMGLPIRRATAYVGKYLAAFVASMIAVVLYAVIILANGVFYFGGGAFTLAFAESFALAILYTLALLGAVFLFSSLFKTSTYAVLVVAVLFLFAFSILQTVLILVVNVEPWMLISYAASVISYPFSSGLPMHIIHANAFDASSPIVGYNPTYLEGIGILLGYFVLTTLGGLFLFEKEEFT